MMYQRKSFTVPASENADEDHWEEIFGSEEDRKKKMANALLEQKTRKAEELKRKLGQDVVNLNVDPK